MIMTRRRRSNASPYSGTVDTNKKKRLSFLHFCIHGLLVSKWAYGAGCDGAASGAPLCGTRPLPSGDERNASMGPLPAAKLGGGCNGPLDAAAADDGGAPAGLLLRCVGA